MVHIHVYWYIFAMCKIQGFPRPDPAFRYNLKIKVLFFDPYSAATVLQRPKTLGPGRTDRGDYQGRVL
jgi:hypothetical protein